MGIYDKEENNMSVFKSYLRGLLRQLKELNSALENGDSEKAKSIVEQLIEDTQKGIED